MPTKLPPHQAALDARDAVDEARAAFVDAVGDWCAALDLTSLAEAFAAWKQAVEAYHEVVSDLAVDYTGSIENRSDKWQESEPGQQVQEVVDEFEQCQMEAEATDALTLHIEINTQCTVTDDNVNDVLPEATELPEEP